MESWCAAILFGISGGFKPLWNGLFSRRQAFAAVILSILYGLSDEWHQSFIPKRNSSWADIAADSLGAAVFMAVAIIWKTVRDN